MTCIPLPTDSSTLRAQFANLKGGRRLAVGSSLSRSVVQLGSKKKKKKIVVEVKGTPRQARTPFNGILLSAYCESQKARREGNAINLAFRRRGYLVADGKRDTTERSYASKRAKLNEVSYIYIYISVSILPVSRKQLHTLAARFLHLLLSANLQQTFPNFFLSFFLSRSIGMNGKHNIRVIKSLSDCSTFSTGKLIGEEEEAGQKLVSAYRTRGKKPRNTPVE